MPANGMDLSLFLFPTSHINYDICYRAKLQYGEGLCH